MKKWIVLLLVLALAMTAAACSCQKQPTPSDGTTVTTEATGNNNKTKTLPGTMEENINKIVAKNPAEFMGAVIPVNLQDTSEEGLWMLKNYTGLASTEKLTDVAVYEPMTGSQAFSLVMVRVADPADAQTVARQMKENIDPRKWICAQADQIMVAGYGDAVMFIMLDSQLGLTAQSYVNAFESVCGGKPDFTI